MIVTFPGQVCSLFQVTFEMLVFEVIVSPPYEAYGVLRIPMAQNRRRSPSFEHGSAPSQARSQKPLTKIQVAVSPPREQQPASLGMTTMIISVGDSPTNLIMR